MIIQCAQCAHDVHRVLVGVHSVCQMCTLDNLLKKYILITCTPMGNTYQELPASKRGFSNYFHTSKQTLGQGACLARTWRKPEKSDQFRRYIMIYPVCTQSAHIVHGVHKMCTVCTVSIVCTMSTVNECAHCARCAHCEHCAHCVPFVHSVHSVHNVNRVCTVCTSCTVPVWRISMLRCSSLNLSVSWSLEGLAPIKLGLQLAHLISASALVNLDLFN